MPKPSSDDSFMATFSKKMSSGKWSWVPMAASWLFGRDSSTIILIAIGGYMVHHVWPTMQQNMDERQTKLEHSFKEEQKLQRDALLNEVKRQREAYIQSTEKAHADWAREREREREFQREMVQAIRNQ